MSHTRPGRAPVTPSPSYHEPLRHKPQSVLSSLLTISAYQHTLGKPRVGRDVAVFRNKATSPPSSPSPGHNLSHPQNPRMREHTHTHTYHARTHQALSLTLCSPSNSLSPLGARTPTEQVLCQGAHRAAKLAPWRRLTSTSRHHGDQQSQQQQRWYCHQPSLPALPSRRAGPQELGGWRCGLRVSCCREPG